MNLLCDRHATSKADAAGLFEYVTENDTHSLTKVEKKSKVRNSETQLESPSQNGARLIRSEFLLLVSFLVSFLNGDGKPPINAHDCCRCEVRDIYSRPLDTEEARFEVTTDHSRGLSYVPGDMQHWKVPVESFLGSQAARSRWCGPWSVLATQRERERCGSAQRDRPQCGC